MNHVESRLQSACVKWFRLQYPDTLIFAIPNGGARNAITGAILKAEGVLAGVPDTFIAASWWGYHGLFIEFKTGKGRLSPHQVLVHSKLELAGYKIEVCRSFEGFKETVEWYMN